jgi:FixJ family two-component response regulator
MALHECRFRPQEAKVARAERPPVVCIIDADEDARLSLELLLRTGYLTRSFRSAAEFLRAHDPETPGCIILDVACPDSDGLSVQSRLVAAGCLQPLIFLTASPNIAMAVAALRAGAINVLAKPVGADDILASVRDALNIDASRRQSRDGHRAAAARLSALTLRERQVLSCVVIGKLNKQIAADLGIVENTVKAHRARIMQKLAVRSIADLVFFALTHDLISPGAGSSLESRDTLS